MDQLTTWKGQTEPPILLWQFPIPALKFFFLGFPMVSEKHVYFNVEYTRCMQFLILSSLFAVVCVDNLARKFQNSPSTKVHIMHQLTTWKGQTEPRILLWRFLIPVSSQNSSRFSYAQRETRLFSCGIHPIYGISYPCSRKSFSSVFLCSATHVEVQVAHTRYMLLCCCNFLSLWALKILFCCCIRTRS